MIKQKCSREGVCIFAAGTGWLFPRRLQRWTKNHARRFSSPRVKLGILLLCTGVLLREHAVRDVDYTGREALGDVFHNRNIALGRAAEREILVHAAQIYVGLPGAVRSAAQPVEYLAEQLQVGTVSNMYEIVERMKQAGKVISL